MPRDERGSSSDSGRSGSGRKPWFGPNRVGLGYHPQTWQGWGILIAVIAVIVIVVVLLRTGLL